MWTIWKRPSPRDTTAAVAAERETAMYEIKFLVWIWKRSFLGFWYKAPVVRTAHADRAAARRLGRLFTFEDMMWAADAAVGE